MSKVDIRIRLAKNDDGDAVATLMKKLDFFQWENWSIDWHDLEPNWLVAEIDGSVVGCIQVVPARPIGRIEVLAVDPDLKLVTKYKVVRDLTDHAVSVVHMYGSQAVSSMIPYAYADYLNGAKTRRHWIVLDEGAMVMRRLV